MLYHFSNGGAYIRVVRETHRWGEHCCVEAENRLGRQLDIAFPYGGLHIA